MSDQAETDARRNAVPPEMVVRVTPTKVTAKVDVADRAPDGQNRR